MARISLSGDGESFSRSRRIALAIAVAFLLMIPMAILRPQAPLGPGEVQYEGYQFDSTFRMGAHKLFFPDSGRSLHLDFTQTYTGPSNLHYYDSTLWNHQPDARTRWSDSSAAAFWKRFKSAPGFMAVFAPDWIGPMVDHTRTSENYWGYAAEFTHAYQYEKYGTGVPQDALPNEYVWPASFPSASPSHDTLMAGRPAFTWQGLTPGGYYDYAAQSRAWPVGQILPFDQASFMPSSPDYSADFDLTVAMQVNVDTIPFQILDSNAVLAYAILYRRDTTGQTLTIPDPNDTTKRIRIPDTCLANFYVPFDTATITKAIYLDTNQSPNAGRGFREPRHMFKFPRWNKISGSDTLWCKNDMSWFFPSGIDSLDSTHLTCRHHGDSLLAALKTAAKIPATTVNLPHMPQESDFFYDLYTTQKVPITFLRARIQPHSYILLTQGAFDDSINAVVDRIYNNPTDSFSISPLLMRIGISDEVWNPKYRPYTSILSKIQRRINSSWSSAPLVKGVKRGIWLNPLGDMLPCRVFTGDFDSSAIKTVQMMAIQNYNLSGAIPITYANIDSMSQTANESYYGVKSANLDIVNGTDTLPTRWVMGNSARDYAFYTRDKQGYLTGKINDMTYTTDIARKRFTQNGVAPYSGAYPVYYVAQVHGHDNGGGFTWRPPTPEEITAQSWLALTSSVDGLVFSDFCSSSGDIGVMHWETGLDPNYDEYDTLSDHDLQWLPPATHYTPKMWLGFRARYGAVKKVTDEFYNNVLPIYNDLVRDGRQINASDTSTDAITGKRTIRTYKAMPLLDTLLTEKAVQFTPTYTATGTFDDRAHTYMQASVFQPGWRRQGERDSNVQYLMVVNRRLWPIDFGHYDSTRTKMLDTISRSAHESPNGLGNIDVRRPWVRFKNTTGGLYKSFIVERVGTSWRDTIAIDTAKHALEWLAPGWGALYRIRPLHQGVSPLGTAYNNAVRSVSLSDTARRAQVVVYERDSIVYAQTMDSLGNWSREFQISDAADASSSGRKAYNMFPSVAPVRNGTAWLFAWERYLDSTGTTTVEARYYPRFPSPDSLSLSRRTTLTSARTITGGYHMTPAVTGADSGFIVAWAVPDTGITAVAIPNHAVFKPAEISSGLTSRGLVKFLALTYNDSLCQYPTLAYVPNYNGTSHAVHLAWQQNYSAGKEIFYRQLQARFPATGQATLSAAMTPEDVNVGMAGCQFINPCIAADSVRVGIAFQSIWPTYKGKATPPGGVSVITLRFRDSTVLKSGWHTLAYYWGDDSSWYERPTMVEFPKAPRSALTGSVGHPEGALSWFRIKGTSSNPGANQLYFYRFGKVSVNRVREGEHPSLTQVPFRRIAPYMTQSSLLYRDADSRQFLAKAYYSSNNDNYVDGLLLNHPSYPDTNFTSATGDSIRLFTGKTLRTVMTGRYPTSGPCDKPSFTGGLGLLASGITALDPGLIFPAGTDTSKPSLPPLYFAPPEGGTFVETLGDAINISRTSIFRAGPSPVTVRRLVYGTSFLVDWLDAQPYDSAAGEPANIRTYLELVRNSDSTVLWRSDTLKARTIRDSSSDDMVSVPVDVAAPLGTVVFIRLRMQPTTGIQDTSFDVSAGFYNEVDTTEVGFLKLTRGVSSRAVAGTASALGLAIIPNPATSMAEIHVTIPETALPLAGTLDLDIYDPMGNLVKHAPATSVASAGEYVMTIDVSQLTSGVYTVRARMGVRQVAGRLTVTR